MRPVIAYFVGWLVLSQVGLQLAGGEPETPCIVALDQATADFLRDEFPNQRIQVLLLGNNISATELNKRACSLRHAPLLVAPTAHMSLTAAMYCERLQLQGVKVCYVALQKGREPLRQESTTSGRSQRLAQTHDLFALLGETGPTFTRPNNE